MSGENEKDRELFIAALRGFFLDLADIIPNSIMDDDNCRMGITKEMEECFEIPGVVTKKPNGWERLFIDIRYRRK